MLIDKTKDPKWKHKNVKEVTDVEVKWFFDREDVLNLDINKF